MTKDRIARIERIATLRKRQKQLRQAEYEDARYALERAADAEKSCASDCENLDAEHDHLVIAELDPLDLEVVHAARLAALRRLRLAIAESEKASLVVSCRRDALLDAHRAHRSLEVFHDKIEEIDRLDRARRERSNLDEVSLSSFLSQRGTP